MKSKLLAFIIISFISIHLFSQNSINDYKYVVVPMQFDFVKGKDRFRLNTLTRHLFKESGYNVYFDEQELPEDLFEDRCLAMYADVKKVKGGLKSVLQIELKDCRGNLIFASEMAKSKTKDLRKAYNEAIRKAFESVKFLDYEYQPNSNVAIASSPSKKEEKDKAEIERLQKEVEELKAKEAKVKKAAEMKVEAETRELEEQQMLKRKEIEKTKEKVEQITEAAPVKVPKMIRNKTLKTELIEGGYRILDSDESVVMVLLKTAAPNVYTVKGKDAIVFKQDGKWVYSENTGSSKVEKVLDVKL